MIPTLHKQTCRTAGPLDLDMEVHWTDTRTTDGSIVARETETYTPKCD